MKKFFIISVILLSGAAGFLFSLYQHREPPVATLETYHYPALFVKQIEGDPRAGEKIFKEFCAACHAEKPVIEMNAPRRGDKQAWEARKKWGMRTLLKLTIDGVGAMPARGGCFECSDEQLEEAILYMLK